MLINEKDHNVNIVVVSKVSLTSKMKLENARRNTIIISRDTINAIWNVQWMKEIAMQSTWLQTEWNAGTERHNRTTRLDYLYDPTIAPVFDRVLNTVWDENTVLIMNKTWFDTKNKIMKTFLTWYDTKNKIIKTENYRFI